MKFAATFMGIILLPLQPYALATGFTAASEVQKRDCIDPSLAVTIWMGYNPDTHQRLYASDFEDFYFFFKHFGYIDVENPCLAFPTEQNGTIQLYSPGSTASPWIYASPESPACGTVPFFEVYNSTYGDYYYTTDPDTRDSYVNDLGYTDLGIAGYVLPTD